ncbi:MAG TPA: LysE family translocator [Bacteroidia bacterium]|nr:LysE family translocator [Bacteroidia bacterium]
MFAAIGQGMLFGLALAFTLGPAFFGLIQTSLKSGYKYGIEMALGVFISDLIYLLLAYFGLSGWLMDDKYAIPVGITGGVLLIGYGLVQALKKTTVQNVEGEVMEVRTPTLGTMALKGFLMNLLNPFVIFLWIGAIGLATNKLEHDAGKIIAFFVSTLITILGTDVLKCLAAHKIKGFLKESIIHKVNVIAGIILIVSGLVLVVRVFVERPWEE